MSNALTGLVQQRGFAQVTLQTVWVHRVLAALLRDRETTSRGAKTGLTDMAGVLAAAVPDKPSEVPALRTWRVLLPHVLAVDDHATDSADQKYADDTTYLLDKAGSYLHWRGQYRTALPLRQRVCQRRLSRDGVDDPRTLQAAIGVSQILSALREYENARSLDADTFARRRRVLGEDHPDTLMSAKALALRALGEYEQVRILAQDTLARRGRVLGEDHPDTLASAETVEADPLLGLSAFAEERVVGVWLTESDSYLAVGATYHVGVKIGSAQRDAVASSSFPDLDHMEPLELIVAVRGYDVDVRPGWQRANLPVTGDTEDLVFEIQPLLEGPVSITVSVYLARSFARIDEFNVPLFATTTAEARA